MRVLHLDSGREMRGGQWQALYLIGGLARAGHESVLLARAGSPLYERAEAAGFDVRPLRLYSLMRVRRWFQVAHAHDARSHTLAVCGGVDPLVVSRRVAFPIGSGLLSRWKYSRPRHYLAVSKYVAATLAAAGAPAGKVSVAYDGVPDREPSRASSRIVAPATEDPMKGTALLKEAAALAKVEIHFSHDLDADLRDAGLFVYITREEGLGSGVLLAMAAGVPVIASNAGGLPELIEDTQTGLLTANDPESIAQRIVRLLNDRELASGLAASARKRAAEHFSVDAMVRGTVAAYEKVV
jgi:glycosyltransferase involved in cell wall biosynthesis